MYRREALSALGYSPEGVVDAVDAIRRNENFWSLRASKRTLPEAGDGRYANS